MAKIMSSEEVHHKLDAVVKEAQDKAKSRAPVFDVENKKRNRRDLPPWDSFHLNEPGHPGDYRNSIVIERVKGKPHVRRLISRDYKAVWIEIGTRHMPEYAILTNIAREYGSKTGPSFSENGEHVSTEDEGVSRSHDSLREAIKTMETMMENGAKGKALDSIRNKINTIRNQRSAAFRAAAPRRRRRR